MIGFYDPGLDHQAISEYIIERAKENGTIPVIATLGPVFGQWAWRKPSVLI